MTKKSLVLHTHTGLGDHLITNGMAHKFSEVYDIVYVPYIKMFKDSIVSLYRKFPKIVPVEFPDIDVTLHGMDLINDLQKKTDSDIVHISDPHLHYPARLLYKGNDLVMMGVATNFDRQFYELADMPFSVRYTHASIPASTKSSKELYNSLVRPSEPYKLVHNTSSQSENGYPIDLTIGNNKQDIPVIHISPKLSKNIFDYVDLIENAAEIHAVGSFFQCLVDSMVHRTKANLFFHDIMTKHDTQINCKWNNNRWCVVTYNRKF